MSEPRAEMTTVFNAAGVTPGVGVGAGADDALGVEDELGMGPGTGDAVGLGLSEGFSDGVV
jgi:hypothetical protein